MHWLRYVRIEYETHMLDAHMPPLKTIDFCFQFMFKSSIKRKSATVDCFMIAAVQGTRIEATAVRQTDRKML